MKRVLFVFALSIMTLSMSAQIQEGAKLDNKQATLDKGKGTENQELTTGKVELEEKKDQKEEAKESDTNRGKKVFGRDVFNNKLLSFEPNMNIATPSNYVLGPGDVIVINIYGGSQSENEYTISNEGTVTVPGYGPISISGLTVAAANAKLKSTLGKRYRSSSMKTSVSSTRSIHVNVMGEVKVPGTYTLSAFATVFHALYMAGGINDLGTLRNIKVYRNGREVSVVDVYQYIMNGRLAGNVRLQDNDVVIVSPFDCLVEITGAVKRPMTYEMRKTDDVNTILEYAGGFANNAYREQLRLQRYNGTGRQVYTVGKDMMSSTKLMDGDVLSVDSMLDRYENMVEVKGAVFRPGMYQLGKGGVNTLRQLVITAQGLTEDANPKHVVIQRLKDDRTKTTLAVDLQAVMDGKEADVTLKNEDVIFIPTEAEKTKVRTLTISGEVQFPGTYEYAEHQTVEDFIVQAGGLTDAASTARVDVARRILNPSATQEGMDIAKTYSFTIQDGLIINKDADFFLEPYDQVYVRRSPGFEVQRNVTVTGEAVFPGDYAMSRKDMRLSDLVKRSGGLTTFAYAKGARIERKMSADERIRVMNVWKAITRQNTHRDSVKLDSNEIGDTYFVGISLDKAMANPGSPEDIILRAGDKLFIPEYNPTVRISGDVMYPNTVSYVPGKKVDYYVDMAGGYGNLARKKKVFIVLQNGKVSTNARDVDAGCEIIVPSKPDKEPFDPSDVLKFITPLASLATVVVALTK